MKPEWKNRNDEPISNEELSKRIHGLARPLAAGSIYNDLARSKDAERTHGSLGNLNVAICSAQYMKSAERTHCNLGSIIALVIHQRLVEVVELHKTSTITDMATKTAKTKRTGNWKPIMDAAFAGNAKKVAALLKAGADPNVLSTTNYHHRPLHRAIEHKRTMPKHEGHDKVVTVLLEHGADPKLLGTQEQRTALQLAAMREPRFVPLLRKYFEPLDIFHAAILCDAKRVKTLLAKDRSLATARDERGYTPLHCCAASAIFLNGKKESDAQLEIAQALIKAGAQVDASYLYDGNWPIPALYFASGYHNNPALTKMLLDAGADPCDHESVYHASDEGHAECLALFEKAVPPKKLAAECTMCLSTQLHWGRTRGLKWLLAHGADPNSINKRFGNSALHEAAKNGASEPVIAALLKHGADPNTKNRDGMTAIDIAKRAKKSRVVQQLQMKPKKGE